MSEKIEIVYLGHSGFAVKTKENSLIFDYYQDDAGVMPALLQADKKNWVFSSHRHADHFNPQTGRWRHRVEKYIFSQDIDGAAGIAGFPREKLIYMQPYESLAQQGLTISTYGSTDEGVSFLVEGNNWRIFHAGDLNWWHWEGDTLQNQQEAAAGFRREMGYLKGLELDVAFFPVDGRLGNHKTLGVQEFCRNVRVKHVIAMHTWGQAWTPGENFFEIPPLTWWCPLLSGENQFFEKV